MARRATGVAHTRNPPHRAKPPIGGDRRAPGGRSRLSRPGGSLWPRSGLRAAQALSARQTLLGLTRAQRAIGSRGAPPPERLGWLRVFQRNLRLRLIRPQTCSLSGRVGPRSAGSPSPKADPRAGGGRKEPRRKTFDSGQGARRGVRVDGGWEGGGVARGAKHTRARDPVRGAGAARVLGPSDPSVDTLGRSPPGRRAADPTSHLNGPNVVSTWPATEVY